MKLTIITPEKTVFDQDNLESVTVPTSDGEITLLPHHVPLVSQVIPGELTIRQNRQNIYLAVTNGFLKLTPDGLITILADYAIRSEDIELAKVQEAKRKAEEMMKDKSSNANLLMAEADLRRTLLELKVASRRQKSTT